MERRNWSLKALEELVFIDSLDSKERAEGLSRWTKKYLESSNIEDFDLELSQLKKLQELFYKNLSFLKTHRDELKSQLETNQKIKKFLN